MILFGSFSVLQEQFIKEFIPHFDNESEKFDVENLVIEPRRIALKTYENVLYISFQNHKALEITIHPDLCCEITNIENAKFIVPAVPGTFTIEELVAYLYL